jgi:hypothetical protein
MSSEQLINLQCDLPDDLIIRILSFLKFQEAVGRFARVSKTFSRAICVEWFAANVRPLTWVPSMSARTLAEGLAGAAATRELLILPGVYRDSIRITKNVSICGIGKLGSVVIEAPGWNDAIYFAGLGMDGEYVDHRVPDTGELAEVSNLVFRAPNPEQSFVAHIVRGTPNIHHCEVQGGISISACRPILAHNIIHGSRSCGVKVTDRGAPVLLGNTITANKFGGVKIKRSSPMLVNNTIIDNESYGVVLTTDSVPSLRGNEIRDRPGEPRFNPLLGVYRSVSRPVLNQCGFCGSVWRRPSLSRQSTPMTAEPTTVQSDNGSRPVVQNQCYWVEPEEISSDDEQLFGDDDLGT